MARQDLAYAITVNDAQLRLATQHVAAFNAELQASTVVGRKVDEQMRAVGRRTVQVGNFFTRYLTIPIGLAGIAAGKMSADFERSLAKIQGLTLTTAADTQRLGKAATALSSSTITKGPNELADAMFKLRSVGFSVNQTIKAMPAIAQAAAAGLGSVETVADAVASALDAYGIAGQNAGKNVLTAAQATSVLIGTITAGKIAPEELARSIGRVIPVANALGISMDQVGAAIASITRQQGSANLAVTGLRALLSQIERAQPQTQRALAAIGTSPAAVLEAVKDPKVGLFPTLLALRDQVDKLGKKPLTLDMKTLASGLKGSSESLAKIKAQVGDSNQALSKLFPNIRALTAFLIITGTRRNQNQNIFSSLAFDVEHSQEVIKRAYEAKLRTPIGQLELQLSKLKTTGTNVGHSFITLGANFLKFVNGVVGAGQSVNNVLQKFGPLKGFFKDAGVGLLIFGPAVSLFGRLIQAASFGVTTWGRWQVAATKAAYAVRGISIDEDKAVIAHRKATVQFVEGFNSVTTSADRAAAAVARVGTGGVRGNLAASTAGAALLTRTSGGTALSRGTGTGSALTTADSALLGGATLAVIERKRALDIAESSSIVAAAQEKVNIALASGVPLQIQWANAELATAEAGLQLARTNASILFPADAKLLQMTRDLTLAQKELSIAQSQGAGISLAASRVATLNTNIRARQELLAATPPTGFAALSQRATLIQQTRAAEQAALNRGPDPSRIMATNFGTAVKGMQSTAKFGFDFIALTFAANMLGKVVFDSHKTKDAVTQDLFDIRKAGVGLAAALGIAGLGLAGLASKAGGLSKLGVALGESGIGAILLQNKLRLAIAALIGLQFAGVKTETIFNAAMVGMLAKTAALRLGIVETGAAFGPWGVAIAAATVTILASTGKITDALSGIKDLVTELSHGDFGAAFGDGGFKAKAFDSIIKQIGSSSKLAQTNLNALRKELLDKGFDADKVDNAIKKLRELKKTATGNVDDFLFKQLEHGLSTSGAIGQMVKTAEQLRKAGNEYAAEQVIAAAQVKQQKKDIIEARNFLIAHGKDDLAATLFPVAQQLKEAKHNFDTLFGNIQNSLDNAFQAHTDVMLNSFDKKTQSILDDFDAKTQQLQDKLKVNVKVPKLNETFTITVNGKTPAERELDALDKVAEKRNFQRGIFDARQELATAFQVGDPNAIRDAQRKLQDAQTDQQKFGLEKRAAQERTAADAATKKAQNDFADRRKRERQSIEDARQDTRRNMEALRTIQQQNLDAALSHEKTLFDNGKISLGRYKDDVASIMKRFNISIAQAGKDGGQAYADQMSKYFTQLTGLVGTQLDKIETRAKKLTDQFRVMTLGLAAVFIEAGKNGPTQSAAAAAALGNSNPVALAKQALGLPTRPAIIETLRQMNGGLDYARYGKYVPKQGRPSLSDYQDFLKKISDPDERTELRSRLRAKGYFGAHTGAVVPGTGHGDTVPAMLTPGEVVFNRRQQRTLAHRLGMPGAGPHELFDEIRRPQRFASGGVVRNESVGHAIRRMRAEGYSDSAIRGQLHTWHPKWSEGRILNEIDRATPVRTSYPPGSAAARQAQLYGHPSIDHAPARTDDLQALRKAYEHSPLIRGLALATNPIEQIRYLISSGFGFIPIARASHRFGEDPSGRSAAHLAESLAFFGAQFVPLQGAAIRDTAMIAGASARARLAQLGPAAMAYRADRKGFISGVGQTYKDIWTKAIYPGDEYSAGNLLRTGHDMLRQKRLGIPLVRWSKTKDYEAFAQALGVNTRSFNLTPHTAQELAQSEVFLSRNAGFVVDGQGDLQNVFNNNAGGKRGLARSGVLSAIRRGAKTLDAYDGFLPRYYSQFGFRETGRMKFIDEYAPPGWDYKKLGRPDVVFMSYEGGARDSIASRFGNFSYAKTPKYYGDWDVAKEISQRAVVDRGTGVGFTGRGRTRAGLGAALSGRLNKAPLWVQRLVREERGQLSPGRLNSGEQAVADWFANAKPNFTEGYKGFAGAPHSGIVNVSDLVATQSWHKPPGLENGPIEVWRSPDGKLFVSDGHHRTARAIMEGKRTLPAKIRDLAWRLARDETGTLNLGARRGAKDGAEGFINRQFDVGGLIADTHLPAFDKGAASKNLRSLLAANKGKAGWRLPSKGLYGGSAGAAMQHVYDQAVAYAHYRRWYEAAAMVAKASAKHEGVSTAKFVKVLAYLSPSEDPTANFGLAIGAIRAAKNEGKLTPETFAKYYQPKVGRTPNGAYGKFKFHESSMARVAEALGVGPKVVGGKIPKLSNYFLGILEDADPRAFARHTGGDTATIDRHSSALVWPGSDAPGSSYEAFASMYREVAQQLGWKTKEVQAASWVPQKAINKAGRWGGDWQRFLDSSSDAYFNGYEAAYGKEARDALMKSIRTRLKYGVPGFRRGGVIGGSGMGDTIPAMLTPGEMVLNRSQQMRLARRLGLGGTSAGELFDMISTRFAGGKKPAPAPDLISEHGNPNPPGSLPPLKIDGLPDLTTAMQKLVKLVAENAKTQQDLPQDPRTAKLILGGTIDAKGKFTRLETAQLRKLRHALDPVHSTDELRSTIPNFDSLPVAQKRELESQIARMQAHPVRSGLISVTATGTQIGGNRQLSPSREIGVRGGDERGGGGNHYSIAHLTIQVDSSSTDPVSVARETRREFERVTTHGTALKRRGLNIRN